MRYSITVLLIALIGQVYSAPQLISFDDGKVGVNFGGYHAGFGLGGLLGGGAGGGLFAEAGTPHGQSARAGLGGAVLSEGHAGGGLYAGATAGGNVKAETGLAGRVSGEQAIGNGFATAGHQAVSGLAGETYTSGSSGFAFSKTKSVNAPATVIKETEISVVPVDTVKHKTIHAEFNVDSQNEINSVPLTSAPTGGVEVQAKPTVIVKEVFVQPQPQIVEKHIIHTHVKPSHNVRKTAYIGGFIGGGANVGHELAPVVKTIQPAVERRIDTEYAQVGAADVGSSVNVGSKTTFTKDITVSRNPTLFQDIFNIPISTLKAVGNLLNNAAASTNVSVQKSASIQSESDSISPKHASSSLSEAHISVETPSASKLIDDVFAIPINTLSAVNTFLQNNVPIRKRVQVSQDGSGEPMRIRLGPHARRRANKQVIKTISEDQIQ